MDDEEKELNEFDDEFDPKKIKADDDDDLVDDLDDGFHSEDVPEDPLRDSIRIDDAIEEEEAEDADADKFDDEDPL